MFFLYFEERTIATIHDDEDDEDEVDQNKSHDTKNHVTLTAHDRWLDSTQEVDSPSANPQVHSCLKH